MSVLICRPMTAPPFAGWIADRVAQQLPAASRTDTTLLADLQAQLNTQQPEIEAVLFFAHGNARAILSSLTLPLLQVEDVQVLAGRRVYAAACSAGRELGPAALAAGARRFVGYRHALLRPLTQEELDGLPGAVRDALAQLCVAAALGTVGEPEGLEGSLSHLADALTETLDDDEVWLLPLVQFFVESVVVHQAG